MGALGSFTLGYYNNCLKFVKFEMGKGNKIRFWEDEWVGENSIAQRITILSRLSTSYNESIHAIRSMESFIRSGGCTWNLRFGRNLNE